MFIQTWEDSAESRVCRRQLARGAFGAVGRYRNKETAVVSRYKAVFSALFFFCCRVEYKLNLLSVEWFR